MECRVFGLLKRSAATKSRLGLMIERDRIALAQVSRGADPPVLQRWEVLPIDPNGGIEAVSAALRGATLPRMPASVVLRHEEYQLALVEAPDVPPAELRAAMRWRLKDAIEFRLEDAVIDVFDVPVQNRGGQGRMMYAVAARREAVERYATALSVLPGFDVVDLPELCLRNLASSLPDAAGGIALLHLAATSATVILVRGNTFYFARQMELRTLKGGRETAGAAAPLDSDAIVLELQRSLDYYERHFDQPPIMRIAITPCGPRAMELAQALNRDSGFEVSALDLNTLLRCEVEVPQAMQADCLLPVAAALREERRTL